MIAIHTKFIGPSNTRAARIKAYILGDRTRKTVTIGYHDEAGDLPTSTDAKYRMAAEMLADHYGWRHNNRRIYIVNGNAYNTDANTGEGEIIPQRYELLSGANGDGSYVFIFSPLATVQAANDLQVRVQELADGIRENRIGRLDAAERIKEIDHTYGNDYVKSRDDNHYIGRK